MNHGSIALNEWPISAHEKLFTADHFPVLTSIFTAGLRAVNCILWLVPTIGQDHKTSCQNVLMSCQAFGQDLLARKWTSFQAFKVYWFLGFMVSWLLGFLVPKFRNSNIITSQTSGNTHFQTNQVLGFSDFPKSHFWVIRDFLGLLKAFLCLQNQEQLVLGVMVTSAKSESMSHKPRDEYNAKNWQIMPWSKRIMPLSNRLMPFINRITSSMVGYPGL